MTREKTPGHAVIQNLIRLERQLHKALPDIISEAHDKVARQAVEYAPLDTGALERSMRQQVELTEDGVTASITFGGGEVDYALKQHEMFPKKRIKGRMKYLESALLELEEYTRKSIMQRFAAVLGSFRGKDVKS